MVTKNFMRFGTPPELDGFQGGNGIFEISQSDSYTMPMRPGDIIKFIFDYALETMFPITSLKLGLLSGEIMVYQDVATLIDGKYWTVQVPEELEEGCYRFIFYNQTYNATEWTEVDSECEVVGGVNTGYLIGTESRTIDDEPTNTALFISNVFQYASWRAGKIIEFRGRQNGWGFDYENNLSFYQTFRLELAISKPAYPEIKKVYRQSNGLYRQSNVTIDKKVTLVTEYFDEATHDALANAIKHDEFYIDGISYFSGDEYEVEYNETGNTENRYYELSQAATELYIQGYDQKNNACGGIDNVEIVPPECLEVNDGQSLIIS